MIQLSLIQFIDFVSRSGHPKMNLVRQMRSREGVRYEPAWDFYKPLREAIIRLHKTGGHKRELDTVLDKVDDPKKLKAYPALIKGYQRFLGRKQIEWFAPPRDQWTSDALAVTINPELGLRIDGHPYVIKLYFRQEKLSRLRADVVVNLMQAVLGTSEDSPTFAILDVRNAKLITADQPSDALLSLLQGEAASFTQMYNADWTRPEKEQRTAEPQAPDAPVETPSGHQPPVMIPHP